MELLSADGWQVQGDRLGSRIGPSDVRGVRAEGVPIREPGDVGHEATNAASIDRHCDTGDGTGRSAIMPDAARSRRREQGHAVEYRCRRLLQLTGLPVYRSTGPPVHRSTPAQAPTGESFSRIAPHDLSAFITNRTCCKSFTSLSGSPSSTMNLPATFMTSLNVGEALVYL
jgi:hypothetical protein